MPIIVWIPIVLLGGLFAAVPFQLFRALLYVTLRLFLRGPEHSDSPSEYSRRVAAILCLLCGLAGLVNLSRQMTLDGGISYVLGTLLATYLVWLPTSGQLPVRKSEDDSLGIHRLG